MKNEHTISDAVDYTGYSDRTIRRAIKNEELEAELMPGPKGQEYRIKREELDKWLMSKEKDRSMINHNDQAEHHKQNAGLVPWPEVKTLEEKIQGAVYRAGQAEGQLRMMEQEREMLLKRVNELENKYETALTRNEDREQRLVELITEWREQARRPWWKKWLGIK